MTIAIEEHRDKFRLIVADQGSGKTRARVGFGTRRVGNGDDDAKRQHQHAAKQHRNLPVAQAEPEITPPPRQTSPSYSTADWPGVTAHCGGPNASAKSPSAPGSITQAASAWR